MALTTYAELQASVADWLARSDLTTQIPDFIALAEARINRVLRLQAMETAYTGTIAGGVIAVPSDWLEWRSVWASYSGQVYPLEPASLEVMQRQYPTRSGDGIPSVIARQAGNYIFGPYPEGNYAIEGVYFARFALSNAAPTNWLLTYAPDAYLYGALLASAPYLVDDARVPVWAALHDQALIELQRQEKRAHLSGGSVAARPA